MWKAQLNLILETRDSVRGLIVNISDVLFDTGKYTLKLGAWEKLAKVAGIILAFPSLNLEVELVVSGDAIRTLMHPAASGTKLQQ